MMNGPFGTMLLADFGADVIKVEPPEGDTMRKTGETFLGDDAVYFLTLNRNKRSIVLDLNTAEGRHTAHRLAEQVDIVVENFRPALPRNWASATTCRKLNPRLIYCSTSAFGRVGPTASARAWTRWCRPCQESCSSPATIAPARSRPACPYADHHAAVSNDRRDGRAAVATAPAAGSGSTCR
jgi:hypothetical protein